MRLNNDKIAPSLQMCEQLGTGAAPDCAQGIYHDYWFSVNGIDDTPKPKEPITEPRAALRRPAGGVRAPVLVPRVRGDREGHPRPSPAAQFEKLCGGLEGLQRHACVTGASVIGPPDPRNQLDGLRRSSRTRRTSRPASAGPRSRTS